MIQNLCGHSRSDMTLDIYTTVTKELKQAEFDDFQKKLKEKKQEWKNRQEKGCVILFWRCRKNLIA